jgi:hypothetical protein
MSALVKEAAHWRTEQDTHQRKFSFNWVFPYAASGVL